MNFSQGHSGTKVRDVNRACFPKEQHQNSTKMGEIHELFVLALSLACRGDSWFRISTRQPKGPSRTKSTTTMEKISGRTSAVSNAELSEFFAPHWVPGRELSEFLSAYHLCDKANSPSFFAELTEFAQKLSEAQRVLFSETVSLVFFVRIFSDFPFFADFPCLFCDFLLLFQGF